MSQEQTVERPDLAGAPGLPPAEPGATDPAPIGAAVAEPVVLERTASEAFAAGPGAHEPGAHETVAHEPMMPEHPAPDHAAPEPAAPARLDGAGLDLLFRTARTTWSWSTEPVGDDTLRELYDLLRLAPTSGNCSPARFMFLRTPDAKARLRPALSTGNAEKTMDAPVLCIVAHDPAFFNDLPRLAPGTDARDWFAHDEELATATAFRNGTLQGAYLIMAARAMGLSCGPMSGFDNGAVDREFFSLSGWRSNFLVALGHGDRAVPGPRAPRLSFDESCRLL